jgi:hypothetical protein
MLELLDSIPFWIGQPFNRLVGGILKCHNMAGYPNDGGVVGHVGNHHGSRADTNIVANADGADDACSGANRHSLTEGWVAFRSPRTGSTKRHALIQVAILPEHRSLANDNTHAVIDEQALPYSRTRVDLDAGKRSSDVRDESRNDGNPLLFESMRNSIELKRVKSGIGENHLERATRGRIPPERGADVTPNGCEC